MRNQKTPEQWRELIHRQQFFNGSNIEYCKKHHISVKMFYKKRVQFAANVLNEALLQITWWGWACPLRGGYKPKTRFTRRTSPNGWS